MSNEVSPQGGVAVVTALDEDRLAGPFRSVRNPDHALGEGSSHDDATAQRLGFRGGTVAGSHHMNLISPIAHSLYGQHWFECGNASLYFRAATTDGENVRVETAVPNLGVRDDQVDVWLRRDDEVLVGEGTLALGRPEQPSAIGRLPLGGLEPDGLRILADLTVGDRIPPTPMRITSEEHAGRFHLAAEVLPWNAGRSPWGKSILIPSDVVRLLYQPCAQSVRGRARTPSTGIFGAIEIRNVNGPAQVDTDYTVQGEVLALGQSPKTELMWYETYAEDRLGRRVAEMRMLIRLMKASSPLWG